MQKSLKYYLSKVCFNFTSTTFTVYLSQISKHVLNIFHIFQQCMLLHCKNWIQYVWCTLINKWIFIIFSFIQEVFLLLFHTSYQTTNGYIQYIYTVSNIIWYIFLIYWTVWYYSEIQECVVIKGEIFPLKLLCIPWLLNFPIFETV